MKKQITAGRSRFRQAQSAAGFAAMILSGAVLAVDAPAPVPGAAIANSAATDDASAKAPAASAFQPDRFAGKAGRYYAQAWGIDSLGVKLVESGELIRFSYRVIDPAHAAPLNDKRLTPSLIDAARGVSLVVPQMENVGMLRQTSEPKENRNYWVIFSNKGRLVKRGDRVDVVIGPFRASNLVVD